MFGWLAKRAERTQREEASRFLDSLRGADIETINLALALAMFWSLHFKKNGFDLYQMGGWIHENLMFPAQIVKLIKQLQKDGNPASTIGLQVWLHSARALMWPELRIYGREIWQELSLADPEEVSDLFVDLCIEADISTGDVDEEDVPVGLEPLRR